jgi:hypothetical protein
VGVTAQVRTLEPAGPGATPASPWMFFRTTGSREQLRVSLDRLRARGWDVSEQQPLAGPGQSWDVLVRPPLQAGL